MKFNCRILSYIILILFFASCDSEKPLNREKAIEYNKKAMEVYLTQVHNNNPDEDSLNIALHFIDKAISNDSTYLVAHSNKVNVLLKMNKYEGAIATLEKIIDQEKPKPELLLTQGNLYEKIGMNEMADIKYQRALEIYVELIKKNPENLDYKASRAYLLIFIDGQEAALKEIEKLSEEYSDNQELEIFVQAIRYFNKEMYLKNL